MCNVTFLNFKNVKKTFKYLDSKKCMINIKCPET